MIASFSGLVLSNENLSLSMYGFEEKMKDGEKSGEESFELPINFVDFYRDKEIHVNVDGNLHGWAKTDFRNLMQWPLRSYGCLLASGPTHTVVKYDRRIAVYTTDFGTEILSVPTEGKSLFLWDCDILGCLPRLESLLSESPLLVQCIYIYSTVSTSLQTYEAECSVADYIIYMCSTFTRLHDNIVMYGVL